MLSKKIYLTSKLIAALVAALAIAALATGCGGGGGSSTASGSASSGAGGAGGSNGANQTGEASEPGGEGGSAGSSEPSGASSPAKAKFVKEANAICNRRLSEGLKAIGAQVEKRTKANSGESAAEVEAGAIHSVLLPVIEALIDELRALGAPPGDEAKVEAFLAAFEEGVEISKETQYTASSVVHFGTKEFKQSDELAREYGLSACALG
jgi:hypothetical protein